MDRPVGHVGHISGDGALCWRLPVTTEPEADEHAEIAAIRPHPEDRSGTGYLGAVGVEPV